MNDYEKLVARVPTPRSPAAPYRVTDSERMSYSIVNCPPRSLLVLANIYITVCPPDVGVFFSLEAGCFAFIEEHTNHAVLASLVAMRSALQATQERIKKGP